MKRKQAKRANAKANAWGKIVALSLIPKPYTGVIRHVATAY